MFAVHSSGITKRNAFVWVFAGGFSISFRFNAIFYFGLGYARIYIRWLPKWTHHLPKCTSMCHVKRLRVSVTVCGTRIQQFNRNWNLIFNGYKSSAHRAVFYRESFWIEDNVSLNTKYYTAQYAHGFGFDFDFVCVSLLRLVQLKFLRSQHNDDGTRNSNNNVRIRRRQKSFFFRSFIVAFREGRNEKFISQSMFVLSSFLCVVVVVVVFHLFQFSQSEPIGAMCLMFILLCVVVAQLNKLLSWFIDIAFISRRRLCALFLRNICMRYFV